jgi:hypothetical protein
MTDYSIKISGPDLNFERSIDLDKVNKIIQVCMDNFQPLSQGIETSGQTLKTFDEGNRKNGEGITGPPSLSIAEYYRKFNPKRNPDKILIFANYMEEVLRQKGFNPEKLKEMFSKVGEKNPKNYSRDFKWAISNGWLDKHHSSEEYYVTNSGKNVLINNFHPDLIKKTKQPNARRSQRKAKQVYSPSKEE